ncbi:putative F0F1-ATPase subunit [Enhygromyxa salina]|uniref:Putative F0F1-ATPase subunit n=1 Tax=Enhygromyxa salina TaxID=215803 RepID=A0A2S9XXX4_9BACT|nr:AtpZ/AtpI family protein [Enhygromyxa salina]PRP97580.1 putative F0F1-ATPase subunit [Enhygromyxa salina]
MAEDLEPVDEARHAKLVEKHVYGDAKRRGGGKAPWFRHTSSASIGIEIAVAVIGCTLIASWLERTYTHWAPWTTVIGFVIGIGAAVKALVRTARQYQREIAERDREQALAGGQGQDPDQGQDRGSSGE